MTEATKTHDTATIPDGATHYKSTGSYLVFYKQVKVGKFFAFEVHQNGAWADSEQSVRVENLSMITDEQRAKESISFDLDEDYEYHRESKRLGDVAAARAEGANKESLELMVRDIWANTDGYLLICLRPHAEKRDKPGYVHLMELKAKTSRDALQQFRQIA